jgi:uncharacterized membrane protein HdeD (DUF308 family)
MENPTIPNEAMDKISNYLQREVRLPQDEAHRRAGDVLSLLPGVRAFASDARALVENWWMLLVRGVLAILFGILTLVQPGAALAALVLLFGVWALIDGVSALVLAISGWRSWQLVLSGLVGIAAGIFTFYRPELTAIALYAVFAAWAIARGILEIAVAIELRKQVKGEVWLVLGGIASILFGVLLIVLPSSGVLAVAWLIGIYALTFGVLMSVLSFRLRQVKHTASATRAPVTIGAPTPQPL